MGAEDDGDEDDYYHDDDDDDDNDDDNDDGVIERRASRGQDHQVESLGGAGSAQGRGKVSDIVYEKVHDAHYPCICL